MDRHEAASANEALPDPSKIPTLKPVPIQRLRSASIMHAKPSTSTVSHSRAGNSAARTLSDSQVLKVLESRRAGTAPASRSPDVAVLPPEDTNTRLVLREAVALNAPVFFAVQLQWSVQPIDVASVSKDPIFQAYRLYAAEGRRAGRAWFFLRLGFFNDAVSAKQVAQYLRPKFASAAVVPVSSQERGQVGQLGRAETATVARRPARRTSEVTAR
jgi:hypothetical protein